MPLEEVVEDGYARAEGMGRLRGLGQLLGVAEQDERGGGGSHGEGVGQGELAGLVDDEHVDSIAEGLARPQPCGASDEARRARGERRRDALGVTDLVDERSSRRTGSGTVIDAGGARVIGTGGGPGPGSGTCRTGHRGGIGVERDLVQGGTVDLGEQVADHGMREGGDPDPQPTVEQGPDELPAGEGLAGARWPLDGEDLPRELLADAYDDVLGCLPRTWREHRRARHDALQQSGREALTSSEQELSRALQAGPKLLVLQRPRPGHATWHDRLSARRHDDLDPARLGVDGTRPAHGG